MTELNKNETIVELKEEIKSEYTRNPLLDFPQNLECFCRSGKKFRNCCKGKLKIMVPKNDMVSKFETLVTEARKWLKSNKKLG